MSRTILVLAAAVVGLFCVDDVPAQWVRQNSGTTQALRGAAVIDTLTAIVVGAGGTILKTTNAGAEWTAKPSGTTNPLNAVAYDWFNDRFYAVGHQIICASNDEGETWDTLGVPDNLISVGSDVIFNSVVYAGASQPADGPANALYSEDGGARWYGRTIAGGDIIAIGLTYGKLQDYEVRLATPWYTFHKTSGAWIWDSLKNPIGPWDWVTCGDLRYGTNYIAGWGSNPGPLPFVWRKGAYDTSWTQFRCVIPSGPFEPYDIRAFPVSPAVYLCGEYGNIFWSGDRGESWLAESTGIAADLHSLSFSDEEHGYAVGDGGTILHTANAGGTSFHTYAISVSAGQHGSVSPNTGIYVTYGAGIRLTFTPDSGYLVDSVFVDGSKVDSVAGFTFANVTSAHSIAVRFTLGTSVRYRRGWNLISIPVLEGNLLAAGLFPKATSRAMMYDGAYLQADTLVLGRGYWLKFGDEETHAYHGPPVRSDSINVVTGWNIIGSISLLIPVSQLASDPPGLVTSNFFDYGTTYAVTDTLCPGRGYWVKVRGDGKLILSSSSVGETGIPNQHRRLSSN